MSAQPNQPSQAPQQPPQPQRQPAATLSQSIALTMVLRRLIAAFLVGPLAVILCPFLVLIANLLTKDAGLVCLLLAGALFLGVCQLVNVLVASPEAYAKQMQANEMGYATQTFVVAVFIVRFLLNPMFDYLGYPTLLVWKPGLLGFVRFAAALCVVQASVLMRYVGSTSIMRCSSFPLVSNPFESFMRALWKKQLSAAILLRPGETSAELFAKSPQRRRYQHPTAKAILSQFLLAILFWGNAVWVILVKSFFEANDAFAGYASVFGCIFAFVLPIVPFIRGEKHELDPEQYLSWEKFQFGWFPALRSSFAAWVVGVAAAVLAVNELPHYWLESSLPLLACLFGLTLAISIFDEFVKFSLFFEPDFDENVEATLPCLLGSPSIAQNVRKVKKSEKKDNGLESEEVRILVSLSEEMGKHMTAAVEEYVEAPLEEDVLKFAVLHALGGGIDHKNEDPVLAIPKRQRRIIQKFIDANRSLGRHLDGERDVVVLIRGLCVYVGGFAEALQVPRHFRETDETWQTPPGALVASTYAVKAIKRCYALVTDEATSMVLSQLVPGVLTCLFSLRNGICNAVSGSRWENARYDETLLSRFPRSHDLVLECDKAAAVILTCKQSNAQQFLVSNTVVEWLQLVVGNGSK